MIKVIAYGLNWENKTSQPEMVNSLKANVLQLKIDGGLFAKSKIPTTVDNINIILAQYPNTKELVLHYSHEISPQLACPTSKLKDVLVLPMLDNIKCKDITIFYGDLNVSKNIRWNFLNNINFIGCNHFHWKHRKNIQKFHKKDFITELEYRRDFNKICSKKFSSLIGVFKSHRIYIASELLKQGYFDKGYTSCVTYENHTDAVKNVDGGWDIGKAVSKENEGKKVYFYTQSIEDRFNQLLPHFEVADIEVMDKTDGGQISSSPLNWFSDSYFNIVNETCFSNDWPYNELFITEKTFKPIVHQMPFIIAGSAGTLEYLRSIGYETFPEIFDESYDNEPNSYKRIDMIIEQIKHACDDPELHNKVYSIQDKLKHNRKLFFNE